MKKFIPPARLIVAIVVLALFAGVSGTIVSNTSRRGVAAHVQSSTGLFVPGDDFAPDADAAGVPFRQNAARYTENGTIFGPETGTKSLVLFDTSGMVPAHAEMHALNVSLMTSHFGQVTALPVERYRAGMIDEFTAVFYIGSEGNQTIPPTFVSDIRSSSTPVTWAGGNVEALTGQDGVDAPAFISRYGWDPSASPTTENRPIGVRYKGQQVNREAIENPNGLVVPHIVDQAKVEVLATAVCGDVEGAKQCQGETLEDRTTLPWAIRSENLTYVGEVPFIFVKENDRYLVYVDLVFDALDKDREPIRQAAVRLEDVSPVYNPDLIREKADFLHARGIPFQIAVIPRYMDPRGVENDGRPTSVTLAQAPQVVAALKYAQSKGATLVQHGTTHQIGEIDNPYNGLSAADFEFFRSICIDNPKPPYQQEACRPDNFVLNTGPLEQDSVLGWKARIEHGRQLFVEAGLEAPPLFETPHYVASNNAYHAMSLVYPTRYERLEFSDGMLTRNPPQGMSLGMVFPFRITDPFGTTVLPENLGNYAPEQFSGHAPKPPEFLIDNAKANLVVRHSTASFFFHPYLPLEQLDKIVTGIEDLGYEFVPATELK